MSDNTDEQCPVGLDMLTFTQLETLALQHAGAAARHAQEAVAILDMDGAFTSYPLDAAEALMTVAAMDMALARVYSRLLPADAYPGWQREMRAAQKLIESAAEEIRAAQARERSTKENDTDAFPKIFQ